MVESKDSSGDEATSFKRKWYKINSEPPVPIKKAMREEAHDDEDEDNEDDEGPLIHRWRGRTGAASPPGLVRLRLDQRNERESKAGLSRSEDCGSRRPCFSGMGISIGPVSVEAMYLNDSHWY